MDAKKAIAAAFGAAMLTAGTSTVAFGQIASSNTGGSATNSQTATGGSNAPSVTGAIITVSGGRTRIKANTSSGKNSANAANRGSAKAGGVKIHL